MPAQPSEPYDEHEFEKASKPKEDASGGHSRRAGGNKGVVFSTPYDPSLNELADCLDGGLAAAMIGPHILRVRSEGPPNARLSTEHKNHITETEVFIILAGTELPLALEHRLIGPAFRQDTLLQPLLEMVEKLGGSAADAEEVERRTARGSMSAQFAFELGLAKAVSRRRIRIVRPSCMEGPLLDAEENDHVVTLRCHVEDATGKLVPDDDAIEEVVKKLTKMWSQESVARDRDRVRSTTSSQNSRGRLRKLLKRIRAR